MTDLGIHFSSTTDEWATPQEFFDKLNAEFHFTLDVCANAENAKCARYFDFHANGLQQTWDGVVWCNPPYGREIYRWVRKAWAAAQAGAIVVMLIPARTDTAWWHEFVAFGEVRFVRGRIKFGGHANAAPFPSAVVIFRPKGLTA